MELQERGDVVRRATTTTTTMKTTTTATTAIAGPSRVVETVNPLEILPSSVSQSDVMTPGPESMPNVPEYYYCRICKKGPNSETLQILCGCFPPDRYVHVSCLNRELTALDIGHCEICNCVIKTKRTRRPIYKWTRHKCKFMMWMLMGCVIIGCSVYFGTIILLSLTGYDTILRPGFHIATKIVALCLVIFLSVYGSHRWSRYMLAAWGIWSEHNCKRRVIIKPHREADDVASRNKEDPPQDIEETPL